MNERDNILGRIREALKLHAPFPGHGPAPNAAPSVKTDLTFSNSQARQWLPAVGHTLEQRLRLFAKTAADLKAEFHLLNSLDEISVSLCALRDAERWTKIATHTGDLTEVAASALHLPVCRVDSGYAVADLENCSAGITQCDALVAQTGSVLLTSRSAGGRALSVLPPHHIVLARREQLLPDLPQAFEFLQAKYAAAWPSFISFITGPSRTGDIERILVLGAHGPRKLTIYCI
jgi:L-lactate dehydrogenase complex protein LldG